MVDQSEKLQVQTATILIIEGQGDQAKTKSQVREVTRSKLLTIKIKRSDT